MRLPILFPLLLFSASFLLLSCEDSKPSKVKATPAGITAKACMDRVIAMDDQLGNTRNHACEQQSLSQTISDYTAALEKIDFTSCPSAFSKAFAKHIDAWKAALAITDKYPELRGEMHDLFEKIEAGEDGEQFKTLVAAIWSTWSEIETAMKN